MGNILILTSNVFSEANANGLCALSLKKVMEAAHHRVCLVGTTKKQDYTHEDNVFSVTHEQKPDGNYSLYKEYVKSLKRIVSPIIDKELVTGYVNKSIEIIEKSDIEIIIAIYYPIETLASIYILKSRYPNIKCVSYELDSATDGIHPGGRGDLLFDKAYFRWMNRLYRKIDRIFIMESHRKHFEEHYSEWINKTEFVDIPVLNEPVVPQRKNYDSPVQFFYTGILDKGYRSPLKALNCLSELSEQNDWQVHFYSRGNCEKILKEWAEKNPRICQHGYVSQEELNRKLSEADILLNIGNANSNSLPSKLISYFALGKPIVHFSLQKNDICEGYLRRYPLALIIHVDETVEQAKAKISEFVQSHLRDRVSYDEVKTTFEKNTPGYSAEKLVGQNVT